MRSSALARQLFVPEKSCSPQNQQQQHGHLQRKGLEVVCLPQSPDAVMRNADKMASSPRPCCSMPLGGCRTSTDAFNANNVSETSLKIAGSSSALLPLASTKVGIGGRMKTPQSPQASLRSPRCAVVQRHSFVGCERHSGVARGQQGTNGGLIKETASKLACLDSQCTQQSKGPESGQFLEQHDSEGVRVRPPAVEVIYEGSSSRKQHKAEKSPRVAAKQAAEYYDVHCQNARSEIFQLSDKRKDTTPERSRHASSLIMFSTPPTKHWREPSEQIQQTVRGKDSTPERNRRAMYTASADRSKRMIVLKIPEQSLHSSYPDRDGALETTYMALFNGRDGEQSLCSTTGNSTSEPGRRGLGSSKGQSCTPEPSRTGLGSTGRLISPQRQTRMRSCSSGLQPPRSQHSADGACPPGGESVFESLSKAGYLSDVPAPCTYVAGSADATEVANDLRQVSDFFSAQMPAASVIGVYRIENKGLNNVYRAVREAMGEDGVERSLWHGTSIDCVRNITLSGFNRAYCGRHGMKFGQGTYFASSADYSVRFCDRKRAQSVMFLANVLVGAWAKGSPELVEPPHRDAEGLTRYDSTVDDVHSPSIFCIFKDFQALPLYVIVFS